MRIARKFAVFLTVFAGILAGSAPSLAQTVLGAEERAMTAAKEGDYDTLRSEILRGENVNLADNDGLTLMMHAVRNEYTDLIALLAENQASLLAADRDGNTALHWAGIQRAYESTVLLMSLGADPNVQNRRGETALMVAVREDDRGIVELLLEGQNDFTIRDYTGRGVLDYARQARDRRIEQLLRDAGAN